MKNFIKESWNEYISFFKIGIKDKKKRKWLIFFAIFVEILLLIFAAFIGYKFFI